MDSTTQPFTVPMGSGQGCPKTYLGPRILLQSQSCTIPADLHVASPWVSLGPGTGDVRSCDMHVTASSGPQRQLEDGEELTPASQVLLAGVATQLSD